MRYPLCTLLIVLAIGPTVVGCLDNSTPSLAPPGFFDRFRVPFPPEVKRVLDEPDNFVLYSIEGEEEIRPGVTEHYFHGFEILGRTDIPDTQQRKSLVEALDEGISKVEHGPAICFWPRHGISVVQGDTRFDLIICFQCSQIHVLDGKGKHIFKTQTTDHPATIFNKALTSAQVPLATPPSH